MIFQSRDWDPNHVIGIPHVYMTSYGITMYKFMPDISYLYMQNDIT